MITIPRIASLCAVLILALAATNLPAQESANPALPGFNAAASDARAIAIADSVMAALGGREAWDDTRHITWRFFGRRLHVWDKWTGMHRMEAGDLTTLMNLNTLEGQAWEKGKAVTDPDTLAARLQRAKSIWINDSYWLVMPYKLKDTGVTLTYLGEGATPDGEPAHQLQLTFENVGDTPENRYVVYVDPETWLVIHWDYFRAAGDAEAAMSTPWDNWQRYGNIMLADDRGRARHGDIAVFDSLPESVYSDPAPFVLEEHTGQ